MGWFSIYLLWQLEKWSSTRHCKCKVIQKRTWFLSFIECAWDGISLRSWNHLLLSSCVFNLIRWARVHTFYSTTPAPVIVHQFKLVEMKFSIACATSNGRSSKTWWLLVGTITISECCNDWWRCSPADKGKTKSSRPWMTNDCVYIRVYKSILICTESISKISNTKTIVLSPSIAMPPRNLHIAVACRTPCKKPCHFY